MKYPRDLVSLVRQKTFSIEPYFVLKDDESPMKVFNPSFSRFKFANLNGKEVAYINLHTDELSWMRRKTDFAANLQIERESAPAVPEVKGEGIAFTTRFRMGEGLKGKSPVEVLMEDYDKGKKALNNQFSFLKKGLDKYPANKTEMDAILEAAKMPKEEIEALKSNTSKGVNPTGRVVTILDIGARPLTRKQNSSGLTFCYEGKVTWDTSRKYPVEVVLENYYAPVLTKDDGTLNVQVSKKDTASAVKVAFSMTAGEWLDSFDMMELSRNSYYSASFMAAYKKAEDAERRNREAAQQAS